MFEFPREQVAGTLSVSRKGPKDRLSELLSTDLDFHDQTSDYASHNFHSFPAKFPPQLPRKFILELTQPGDTVLDPMAGSGTALVEALLLGRRPIGFDIDPLALHLAKVKTTALDMCAALSAGLEVLNRAKERLSSDPQSIVEMLATRWRPATKRFIDYWFAEETQRELAALVVEIDSVRSAPLRSFLELTFSSIIITKSGGVSLAFDLAHTRPHRAKIAYSVTGDVLLGADLIGSNSARVKLLTKRLRSPLGEFERRIRANAESLLARVPDHLRPAIAEADSQSMPLLDCTVDLIVTSPPYASNAIDYMRAHKFSLVWLGHPVQSLSQRRGEYIGGEATSGFHFEVMPESTLATISHISSVDERKGMVLHRYYSEMTRVLREMWRVLKPGCIAIVVVGNSIMRGMDAKIPECLCEIGQSVGFLPPVVGLRSLDRNRRMMPAGAKKSKGSQIEQRMHEEYVIGFRKPVD